MIDNFDILKPLMYFEGGYYHLVMIVRRKKENNGINERIGTMRFFGSIEKLEEVLPEFKELADKNKARVYINLIPQLLSDEFVMMNSYKRDVIYGIKEGYDTNHIVDMNKVYSLYDADYELDTSNTLNKILSYGIEPIIIRSSEGIYAGEHWLVPRYIALDISNSTLNHDKHWYIDESWACLYYPNIT